MTEKGPKGVRRGPAPTAQRLSLRTWAHETLYTALLTRDVVSGPDAGALKAEAGLGTSAPLSAAARMDRHSR